MGDKKKERTVTVTDDNVFTSFDEYEPSVTWSVFVYWILPVLAIACMSRFLVDPLATSGLRMGDAPVPISAQPVIRADPPTPLPTPAMISPTPVRPPKKPVKVPTFVADKPTSYIEAVKGITKRRINWDDTDASPVASHDLPPHGDPAPNPPPHGDPAPGPPPLGASTDQVRNQFIGRIDDLRDHFREDPTDLFRAVDLADTLRLYDVQYHDGGTTQEEAIKTYKTAIFLANVKRQNKQANGEETKSANVPEEITMPYSSRSIDGILCALYTSIGKVYFMSNMFEKAVESYTEALDLEPLYLDAMAARGSSRIILGHYEGAASDFTTVMKNDNAYRFLDVYTGLSRILQARESAVPSGWGPVIDNLNKMIPEFELQHASLYNDDLGGRKTLLAKTLNRLFHVLFLYNDHKTKDTDAAWDNLSKAYRYKMGALPPWNPGLEIQKISTTKQIFSRGFWPEEVGSKSVAPVFIIGFVRSGSTLLERVLDAHPKIVGTGENSVFNGRLDNIRNVIVETSLLGDPNALSNVISSLADDVVDEMKKRWKNGFSGDRADDEPDPERFADKMLTNYYNVGFIHMLFPKALILHVVREPMDSIFSAYKHEFPQGTLDYTSDFPSLAELYHGYRDLMDHWDRELPGRVTHIRYEDMVHDMPGVAKKIIEATNLDWDDSILNFHKKKHAVNTLSTTQVRKGVYKDSLQAWKRYEKHLGPLLKLVGDRTTYNIKTTLPGYKQPPPPSDDEKIEAELEAKGSIETTTSEEVKVVKDESPSDDEKFEEEPESVGEEAITPQEVEEAKDELPSDDEKDEELEAVSEETISTGATSPEEIEESEDELTSDDEKSAEEVGASDSAEVEEVNDEPPSDDERSKEEEVGTSSSAESTTHEEVEELKDELPSDDEKSAEEVEVVDTEVSTSEEVQELGDDLLSDDEKIELEEVVEANTPEEIEEVEDESPSDNEESEEELEASDSVEATTPEEVEEVEDESPSDNEESEEKLEASDSIEATTPEEVEEVEDESPSDNEESEEELEASDSVEVEEIEDKSPSGDEENEELEASDSIEATTPEEVEEADDALPSDDEKIQEVEAFGAEEATTQEEVKASGAEEATTQEEVKDESTDEEKIEDVEASSLTEATTQEEVEEVKDESPPDEKKIEEVEASSSTEEVEDVEEPSDDETSEGVGSSGSAEATTPEEVQEVKDEL